MHDAHFGKVTVSQPMRPRGPDETGDPHGHLVHAPLDRWEALTAQGHSPVAITATLDSRLWAKSLYPSELPRLFFYSGGCKTMITTNLGEAFCRWGTRYFHGWHYSVPDGDGLWLAMLDRWLADPADELALAERLPEIYRAAASDPMRASYHPRLMDADGVHRPSARPAGPGEALA